MPPGGEEAARGFYGDLLEMDEVTAPAAPDLGGDRWFHSAGLEIRLAVDAPFAPAAEAHAGILSGDLDRLADGLEAAGYHVEWDPDFPRYRRLATADPFGNPLVFLQPRD
jgi:hypothetical protein